MTLLNGAAAAWNVILRELLDQENPKDLKTAVEEGNKVLDGTNKFVVIGINGGQGYKIR